ncbi:hypothetical protein TRFO_02335 [Tritrichomonas foetus]|uniref:SCP domain-containing protein n=1 Tax=Tritrichomonas foetus TaxID=1144522 RepID=A0A1J4J2Y4_9EUKA|nr:hypothetical protein TRFO_02335 [Tritrichomonas foetus]|eukprot:OHS93816.1 hypothetical protein TRFO_02335 [Tritrichomonas foetus]
MINELRQQCKLTPIKSQQGIDDYATMLVTDYQSADLNNDAYVIMSNMSFVEEFDGKTSAAELIQKWMGEPNRRPVLFAPGKQGSVQFVDLDGQIYISVVVVSFFH